MKVTTAAAMCLYRLAQPADLPGVARVFMAAFPETMHHYFPHPPAPELVAEPFAVCLAAEPEAFWVAEVAGQVAGYIFAPADAGRLWRVALCQGFPLRWLWRWATGRYRMGLGSIPRLLASKVSFWRSARTPGWAAPARILSVAVHPDHQGRGIGRRLCELALGRLDRLGAPQVRLEVRPDNTAALRLYERLGFRPVGTATDTQGTWLVMIRERSGQ